MSKWKKEKKKRIGWHRNSSATICFLLSLWEKTRGVGGQKNKIKRDIFEVEFKEGKFIENMGWMKVGLRKARCTSGAVNRNQTATRGTARM